MKSSYAFLFVSYLFLFVPYLFLFGLICFFLGRFVSFCTVLEFNCNRNVLELRF